MKGLNILYVAAWRIFTNMGVAFRLSALWLLISLICVAVLVGVLSIFGGFFTFIGAIISFVVLLYVMSCIAVGWHRFALRAEVPKGWLYLPREGLLKAYIIAAVKYAILTVILSLVIMMVLGVGGIILALSIQAPTPPELPMQVLEFVLNVVFGAFFAGLALILPAAALKQRFSLGDAFSATMDHLGTLLVLSIAYNLIALIYQFVLDNLGLMHTPGPLDLGYLTALIFVPISGWFFFMFGIGYISELYGTLVIDEGGDEIASATL